MWRQHTWLNTVRRVRVPDWILRPMRGRSLGTHLLAVALIVLVPLAAVAIAIAVNADAAVEQARRARTREIAFTLAGAIGHEIGFRQQVLTIFAANMDFTGGLRPPMAPASMALLRDLNGAAIMFRPAPAPNPPAPNPPLPNPPTSPAPHDAAEPAVPDAALRTTIAAALATGRPQVSDVAASQPSLTPITSLVVPVIRAGSPVGTLDSFVPTDHLIGALRRNLTEPGGFAVLVDRSFRIAAATRDVARLVGQIYTPGTTGNFMAALPGDSRGPVLAQAPVVELPGWQVIYFAGAQQAALIGPGLDTALIATVAAFALAVAMTLAVVGRFSAPLVALTDLVRNVATGSRRADNIMAPLDVAEFEELRQGMVRADAVLRRRAAAERMALREARTGHELLVSVVNGTAEWIHVKDLELRYVLVNRAGLMAGAAPFAEWEVLGRAAADLFPPEVARRIEEADRLVLGTGRSTSFEQEYIQTGTGRTMWLAMTIAPWEDAAGRIVGIVSVSRDITTQRQADARLRAIQADLLRATRLSAMGAMASGLAHELNQPLAAATNYLNAGARLLDRAAQGDAQVFPLARSAVADAAQQMLRAGAIVRRLRDFVERGEVSLQLEDTGDLLREACDLARSDGLTEGIVLSSDIEDDVGAVMVDRTQIQQVLLNLIRNAAEAIVTDEQENPDREPAGTVMVRAGHAPGGGVSIDVVDNGPGLSPGINERLFEPFVSTKQSGMGIGLAICRTIIEGHGGTLNATPNATRGMRFRITLPALLSRGDLG